ncbi:MAG: DUF1697 domain-containing protein [Balneolaceae bacterium]
MNRYIALFRGINVGGRNSLSMKDLAGILEDTGCVNIRTYIQSGNVVLDTDERSRAAGEIGARILEQHGFEPKLLMLDVKDFKTAIENNPFDTNNGKALHFFFLESEPEYPDVEKLEGLKTDSEEFELHRSVFYLHAPDGIGRSKLAGNVEKSMGVSVTARNWNTVLKLQEMASQ